MPVALLLTTVIAAAPSPQEYYSQALRTMNALPQPKYATFEMDMQTRGIGIAAECNENKAAFALGWGRGLTHSLTIRGAYRAADNAGLYQRAAGTYCADDIALFKPAWSSLHDWIRYGLFSPPSAAASNAPQTANTNLPTIASVTAVAPSAYRIYDEGSQACPGGARGHALHLIAKRDPDHYPLTDVVVEQQSLRFCMLRLRLFGEALAGTGAKGDTTVSMGQVGPYWMMTASHTAMSARLIGAAIKSMILDVHYRNMTFPGNLTGVFPTANGKV